MNKKFLLLWLLAAASSVCASVLVAIQLRSKTAPINAAQEKNVQHYTQLLQKEEQQIFDAIEKAYGISQAMIAHEITLQAADLAKVVAEYTAEYLTTVPQHISEETQSLISTLLQENGMNPQEISLVVWDQLSEGAAFGNVLFINEQALYQLSPASRMFVIAHEIQHFLNKDTEVRYALERLLNRDNLDGFPYNDPINQLHRLQESRADIGACLQQSACADGCVNYCKTLNQNSAPPTYPSTKERVAYAQEITTAWKQDNITNTHA